MISQGKADTINKFLKEGMSYRAIQLKTGYSRSTIADVKKGRWSARQRRLEKNAINSNYEYRYPSLEGGISERCPDCGVMIFPPCHACWIRIQIILEAKRRQQS